MTTVTRQIAVLATCALLSAAAAAADVTVPMSIEGGRPYVDVVLTGADGQKVKAHAWLDTGGGGMILTQKLADALGLKPTSGGFKADGDNLASLPVPDVELGGSAVKLTDPNAFVVLSSATKLQNTDADMGIPVRALRGYDVVFDYPAGRFSLATSGGKHSGTEVPVHIGDAGMPTVTVQVDGKAYGVLLDTGGTSVMLSQDAMQGWIVDHKDWPRLDGAWGRGNMALGKFESKLYMLDIGQVSWGPFGLEHVIAVSRPAGIYEKSMTQLTGAPIVGSLGGNVFQYFRMDIDYPKGKLYLTQAKGVKPAALDMVGVSLEPAVDGGYAVAQVQGDVGGLAVGDHLSKVGDLDVSQATLQATLAALSGKPGETRAVTVQRGDKTLTFQAPVQHLLGAKD